MSNEKVISSIKIECDRQRVGEDRQEMLLRAYKLVCNEWLEPNLWGTFLVRDDPRPITKERILQLAEIIEPSNGGVYRTTPVSFKSIVGGVTPSNIHIAMQAWFQYFNEEYPFAIEDVFGETSADPVINEFLLIHPFSDGNGRLAWLLRVWLLNQWDDPKPLPNYFG